MEVRKDAESIINRLFPKQPEFKFLKVSFKLADFKFMFRGQIMSESLQSGQRSNPSQETVSSLLDFFV